MGRSQTCSGAKCLTMNTVAALLDPRSHCGTRCVRCAHCAQTAAMSQMTKRVLRTRRPRACAARRRRGAAPADHPHLCAEPQLTLHPRNAASLPSRGSEHSPLRWSGLLLRAAPLVLRKGVGGWLAARLCGAEQRSRAVGARAARASSSDSSRLFERSERSERSEFRDATARRAAQGSRPARPTAAVKRCKPPVHGFAALDRSSGSAASPAPLRPWSTIDLHSSRSTCIHR